MWGVDNEICQAINHAYQLVLSRPLPDKYEIEAAVEKAAQGVLAMIVKEEDIMIPMLAEVATPKDWQAVRADEDAIGYTLISKPINWQPTAEELAKCAEQPQNSALAQQLNQMAQSLAAVDAQSIIQIIPIMKMILIQITKPLLMIKSFSRLMRMPELT